MAPLTQEALLSVATNLLFFFTIGSFGAFTKDFYETITKKNERIRFGKILIGGTCATVVCYGLQDSWLSGFSINQLVLTTFLCGVLGFEIFGNFTTIVKFKQFVLDIWEFKSRFSFRYQDPAAPPPVEAAPPPPAVEQTPPAPAPDDAPVASPEIAAAVHTPMATLPIPTNDSVTKTAKKEDTSR